MKPLCPICKRPGKAAPDGTLVCALGHQFDPRDDGDYSDRNAGVRLEREERERERKLERLGRRR